MANSNDLDFIKKKIEFVLWILFLSITVQVQGKDMSLPLSSTVDATYELNLQFSDLRREISLDEAVGEILRSDLKARKSILEAKLPDDISDGEFSEKLIDYANVRLVNDAERLKKLYRSDDKIWVFESQQSHKKSKGFLLMRSGEVVHVVIVELILT